MNKQTNEMCCLLSNQHKALIGVTHNSVSRQNLPAFQHESYIRRETRPEGQQEQDASGQCGHMMGTLIKLSDYLIPRLLKGVQCCMGVLQLYVPHGDSPWNILII